MAKAFTTVSLIRGKEPMLRRMVFEVRYDDGQLYLDRCGRLLKELLAGAPDWVVSPTPTPQGTSVFNLRTGMQLGISIASTGLTLDKTGTGEVIDPGEVDSFLAQVEGILTRVLDELEVKQFTRVGYREYFHFPCESKEEAEKWLQELGLVTVTPDLYAAFGGTPDAVGISVVLQAADLRYRIALSGVEQAAQVPVGETILTVQASAVSKDRKKALIETLKKQRQHQVASAFVVALDIDAYLLEPAEPDLLAFAQEQSQSNLKRFREALPKDSARKGK